jgi:hypothetical protein
MNDLLQRIAAVTIDELRYSLQEEYEVLSLRLAQIESSRMELIKEQKIIEKSKKEIKASDLIDAMPITHETKLILRHDAAAARIKIPAKLVDRRLITVFALHFDITFKIFEDEKEIDEIGNGNNLYNINASGDFFLQNE